MTSVEIMQIALIVFIGVVITQIIDYKRIQRKREHFREKMEEIRQIESGKSKSKGDDFRLF